MRGRRESSKGISSLAVRLIFVCLDRRSISLLIPQFESNLTAVIDTLLQNDGNKLRDSRDKSSAVKQRGERKSRRDPQTKQKSTKTHSQTLTVV